MKIRIDGHELLVKKTTRALVEWQRQSGLDASTMTRGQTAAIGAALAAFCALHNAGFNPSWEDLMDRDVDEFDLIEEPGDNRPDQVAVVPDPPQRPADSGPVAAPPEQEWPPPVE